MVDVEQQISELKQLTETATIVDMSRALGVATSTARGWKVRGKVPESIMLKARQISHKQRAKPTGYIDIAFYDIEASAGNGVLVEREEQSNAIVFSERFICNDIGVSPTNIFLMPVKGDSMYPTLKNNCLVMVNRLNQLAGDGVYVFRYDSQLMVKRLQFSKAGVAVVSDNTAYQTWELSRSEMEQEDFEIIGEVVWSGQRM